ncbi:hypothetical protein LKL24_04965 [Bacillus halotolerans]|uniref:hypothetical protein n=1 Tax=Bacillus halotolerans TaxID=260554 RepID=UPI001D0E5824|nr:hypothetical protein [Bacillus halotolerans]MCC2526777.1 hypothetical protein [Bacillus halotolerans]
MNDKIEELKEELRDAKTLLLHINSRMSELDYLIERRRETMEDIEEIERQLKSHKGEI